jgi:hypothetical protein
MAPAISVVSRVRPKRMEWIMERSQPINAKRDRPEKRQVEGRFGMIPPF